MAVTLRSRDERETVQAGQKLASGLSGGSVVLLFGDLGVGKTAFVRGLVEGAGGSPTDVSSPTFTLIQPYAGRLTVQHVDLYRLEPAEIDDLGLEELVTPSALVAIEWADRMPRPWAGCVRVFIDDRGGNEREIRIEDEDRPASGC